MRRLPLLLATLAVALGLARGPAALDRIPGPLPREAAAEAPPVASPDLPAAIPAVVREVLGQGLPPAAPGQALALVRYVIPPGTTLATHVHPGVQIASIASGRLTYTVLLGEVPVTRATGAGTPGPTESIAAGGVTVLGPGDAVVENPGVVHFGRNDGAEPVVILAATLLAADQPPAIVVNDAGTPVTG